MITTRQGIVARAVLITLCILSVAEVLAAGEPLRVGTLNLGLGDFGEDVRSWPERGERLANLVGELELDILALQEVWSIDWETCDPGFRGYLVSLGLVGDRDKAELLRRVLPSGYEIAVELIGSEDQGRPVAGLSWGLAVVTRLPKIASEHRRLPLGDGDRYPRIVQRARLGGEGEAGVTLINVHLSAESHRSRVTAARAVVGLVRNVAVGATLLAGDLNATPDSAPVNVLAGPLRDLWSVAASRRVLFDGLSAPVSGALFRTTSAARVDYLFGAPGVKVEACEYRHDDGAEPALSDHPLVVCTLR